MLFNWDKGLNVRLCLRPIHDGNLLEASQVDGPLGVSRPIHRRVPICKLGPCSQETRGTESIADRESDDRKQTEIYRADAKDPPMVAEGAI